MFAIVVLTPFLIIAFFGFPRSQNESWQEFEFGFFFGDGFEIELIHRNEIVEVINVNLWKNVEGKSLAAKYDRLK